MTDLRQEFRESNSKDHVFNCLQNISSKLSKSCSTGTKSSSTKMNEFAGYSSTRLSENTFSKMPLHFSFSSITPFTFRTKNLKKKKKGKPKVVGGFCALSSQSFFYTAPKCTYPPCMQSQQIKITTESPVPYYVHVISLTNWSEFGQNKDYFC